MAPTNRALIPRLLAISLLLSCSRCDGGEAIHASPSTPSSPVSDAGQPDAKADAGPIPDAGEEGGSIGDGGTNADSGAALDDAECAVDADCPGQDEVCLSGNCLRCGPARALVQYVYDGDTLTLANGARVRLLLVNTPEVANSYTGEVAECYGDEARALTESLVRGRTVSLAYDETCRDRYDRLLAWVTIDGLDLNAHLLEQGAARVMYVAPNGGDRYSAYKAIEAEAREAGRGMWGECQ